MNQTPDPEKAAQAPARPRGARRIALVAGAAAFAVMGAGVVVGGAVVAGFVAEAPQIPPADQLWSVRRTPGMTFLDRDGHMMATRGAKYGAPVKLEELPPYASKAFLAAEDRRFYEHGPVDPVAIARAIATDLRRRRSAEGASTLTQQLARTLFLKREQSLKRKVQEAWLAWQLEQRLSKDQVLELYLNRTYFGDGAYGLEAASETYFGVPASKLTLIQAATLAGLPNAPSRLALTNDMPAALARAHKVLGVMRQQGWIGDAQLAEALATTPQLASAHRGEGDYGYVIDAAEAEADQLAAGQARDLVVTTTIEPALQTAGTDAVREVVLKEAKGRNVSQGALVTLAPDGAILAMVGGIDHDESPFNRVTQARRQPGSAFKAFVYGAAVEKGATAEEVRDDAPVSYGRWTPANYGHQYAGPVTLEQALARSLNTVSVRLTLEIGASTVADFAHRLGLTDIPDHPGPSIALGAYEVSPLELAAGYQVFQDGGGRTTPYLVSQIRTTRGDPIYTRAASAPTPVLDPLYATRMVGMLKAVIAYGTGTAANIGRPEAGKTGTSQDYRDAWFVGFTPDLLTAVWVGNDNGAPMAKVTGGEFPAAIWKRYMTIAEKSAPPADFPWLVNAPPGPGTPSPSLTAVADDEPPMLDAPDSDLPADPDLAPPTIAPPGPAEARTAEADGAPPPPQTYAESEGDGRPYAGPPPRGESYGRWSEADDPPPPPPQRAYAPPPRRWQGGPDGYADEEGPPEGPPRGYDGPPPRGYDGPPPRGYEGPPPYGYPADEDPRYRY